MVRIETERQYGAACERMEELLKIVGNDTPSDNKDFIELDLISNLIADYEEEYFPVKKPDLIDAIKLRMYEMELNQTRLSVLLGISKSRVSEYLNGKSEPTLSVARSISKKLNISASIVLGA
jgi:HTH-type transcriptional regulator/antitoxin HigA